MAMGGTSFIGTFIAACAAFVLAVSAASASDPAEIRQRLKQLKASPKIDDHHIAADEFLHRFYAARDHRPAWRDASNRRALTSAIATSWIDGLNLRDFHAMPLGINRSGDQSTSLSATDREILMTDALLRLLYQLHFGKVDPHTIDSNWNYTRALPVGDPVAAISKAIDAGQVAALIERVRPKHSYYEQLRATLQAYFEYDLRGGWPSVPDGPVLKPGQQDGRIAVLRDRLRFTGHYDAEHSGPADLFDPNLSEAVRRFQEMHGIDVDGVVGPGTLATLNVPARARVQQIRANLERARWVLRALKGQQDLIVVNIAGFYLRVVLDGKPVWRTNVITGRTYHKTPVFTEVMRYAVLNPDWVVPRSIIRNEIFPKAKADPSYLTERNFRLVGSNGSVDPQSLDWSAYSPRSFPFRVIQGPGTKNALGRVKFIFPNRYNVYLHDTPSRSLFSKTGRAFSHGCIRVQDPIKLAEILLGARAGWDRGRIDQALASGRQTRVNLKKPLRVAILYWTVDPGLGGTARFYNDVYKRDGALIKALDAEFRPRPPTARR